jgi:UDP-2-acetamido-3-amino-2,3-dideoxy-glucuronate N-acetyltransferase
LNNSIKIGLIGYGYWGKNLVRNLYELNSLSAICDTNADNLDASKKLYPNINYFNNIDDFLKSDIEALVIATPAVSHESLVRRGLNANKHIFVEKPLCLNKKEGKDLKELANKKGLKLMVGHLLLYHPAFIALKHLITTGGIGKIRYIYSNRLSLGKLRKEENALWSFAPHDISMILSLIGKEPISVEASGGYYLNKDVADTTMTFMTFEGGIKAHVFVSWLHPFKDQRLVVVGDKAMATFVDVEKKEKKLLLYNHDIAWDGDTPKIEKAEGKPIEYDMSKEPLKEECKSFINWIINDTKPPSDAAEGLRVLNVLDRADKELKRKKLNE